MKLARLISSVTLMACAFLALIAGINAANPKWGPLDAVQLTFPLLRGGSTSVYTGPISNRIILFAGYSSDDSLRNPRLNDVWVLTNANGLGGTSTWSQLMPSSPLPPVRYKHSAVYDVANNRMIIYGGCGSPYSQQACIPILNDVWVLSNANGLDSTPPTWTKLFPTSAPPFPRQGHQAVYDPKTNSMIVWAGHSCCQSECGPGAYSDVWVLSNANGLGGTPNWTPLSPIGGPPAGRYFSTAVYDSLNNIMVVFGGLGLVGEQCTGTNAVWALSHANGTGGTPVWSNLIPQDATGSPANRLNHAAVYQPSSNTMIIFGGIDFNHMFLGDTWVLSHANGLGGAPVWKQLTNLTGPAPSARWNSGGIDTMNNLMIMFGGVGDGVENGAHVPLWSTWVLSDPDGL